MHFAPSSCRILPSVFGSFSREGPGNEASKSGLVYRPRVSVPFPRQPLAGQAFSRSRRRRLRLRFIPIRDFLPSRLHHPPFTFRRYPPQSSLSSPAFSRRLASEKSFGPRLTLAKLLCHVARNPPVDQASATKAYINVCGVRLLTITA